MPILRTLLLPLLIPLSCIYGFIISIRNSFYNISLFRFTSFEIPIISIGNITTGGTGKTPMVISLTKLLQNNGLNPGIVSRGYGRNSRGMLMVHDGNRLLIDVDRAGDEPYLMGKELNNIPIIVSANRTAGINELANKCSVDIVVMDDAFQHRRVERNMDIVMISAYDNLDDYHLLPWGILREPINELKRAQFVIYTKTNYFQPPPIHNILKPYLLNSPIASIMSSVLMTMDEKGYHKALPVDEPVFAFCGIAKPSSFIQTVKEMGLIIAEKLIFKDHQKYNKKVLQNLSIQVHKSHCRAVVTTEKDLVKIPEIFMKEFTFYIIKINMVFENDSDVIDIIKPVLLPSTQGR